MTPLRRWAMAPLTALFSGVTRFRALAFDRGFFSQTRVGVPVISIGNLSVGGTGKTPVTAFLARDLLARGLRVGLASRGHGSAEKAVREVPVGGSPRAFGDEPAWYKSILPDLRVVVGVDRVAVARELADKVDVILLDDGFQHRWLARDIDIVLIDMSSPIDEDALLPEGRWREHPAALTRADALLLTKVNLATDEQIRAREIWIERHARRAFMSRWGWRVDDVRARIGSTGPRRPGAPVFLPVGVGQPRSVVQCLLSWSPDLLSCLRERFQADHFEPQRKDVERWITEANASGGEIWLTEKDWIKWQRFSSDVDFRGVSVREIALSVKPDSETAWSEWWSEKLVSLDLVDSK